MSDLHDVAERPATTIADVKKHLPGEPKLAEAAAREYLKSHPGDPEISMLLGAAIYLLRRDNPRIKWGAIALMGIAAMQWVEGILWLDGPTPHGSLNQFLTVGLIPLALLFRPGTERLRMLPSLLWMA